MTPAHLIISARMALLFTAEVDPCTSTGVRPKVDHYAHKTNIHICNFLATGFSGFDYPDVTSRLREVDSVHTQAFSFPHGNNNVAHSLFKCLTIREFNVP